MLAGDVAERHDGTERNAGPWVIAAHDTRAILANPRAQIVTIYGFLKRLSVNAGGLRKLAQRLSGLQVAVAYIDADRHRRWLGITKTVFPDGRMVADQPRRSLRIPLAIGNHRRTGVVIGIGLVGKAFAAAIHRDDAGLVAVD